MDKSVIKEKIKSYVIEYDRKTIAYKTLLTVAEDINSNMPTFIQSAEGKSVFLDAISMLIGDGYLEVVGTPTIKGHHLKYRVRKNKENNFSQLKMEIATKITPPASSDFYLRHPEEYQKDKPIIEKIIRFIKCPGKGIITVNERAFEIFGDEKFLKGDKDRSRGSIVLNRLRLGYSSLLCEETTEPFFSFVSKSYYMSESKIVVILENKDTFWSFKKQTIDRKSSLNADMIIYGEGKKIIQSFKYIKEYDINPKRDIIYYFGDLDPEGINIYCYLQNEYPDFNICPLTKCYEFIYKKGKEKEFQKTPKNQQINENNIFQFVWSFNEFYAREFEFLLKNGLYVPQEAISSADLGEMF